jgi:hypothetical protein
MGSLLPGSSLEVFATYSDGTVLKTSQPYLIKIARAWNPNADINGD